MMHLSRRGFSAALASSLILAPHAARAAAAPRLNLSNLERFRRRAFELGASGLVVATADKTLLSAGEVSAVSRIASIRKSFVSALIGIAVSDGRMNLDTTVAELGIDDYSPLTAVEKRATLRNLIEARSGIYLPTAAESPAMKAARPLRGTHPPGTFWYYNNWDFNVLGDAYQRATGEDLFAGIANRILRPLGFQDFDPLRDMKWDYDPDYPRFPAYNMWMSPRDMVRFGQLFLRRGEWGGKQLVPAAWVKESTTAYSRTDHSGWGGGYGYLWWIASNIGGASTEGLPLGAFSAAGNGGRWITVFPDHDLVVAVQPIEIRGQPQSPIYTDKSAYTQLLKLLFE
jgi:CubicO group peptidase (beta-lactamase class C family)